MFENIEQVLRCAGKIRFEEERYGDGIMVCIDIGVVINNAAGDKDATIIYYGCEIYDTVDAATNPGDIDAMNALEKLETFAEMHPEFLYARGKSFEEALNQLEKRAALWNQLSQETKVISEEQEKILLGFAAYDC